MTKLVKRVLAELRSQVKAGVLNDTELAAVKEFAELLRAHEYLMRSLVFEKVPVELDLVVFKGTIKNILMSAFEGGIDYWCDDMRVEGELLGKHMSNQIELGGALILHDAKAGSNVMLTKEKMLQGIQLYVEQPRYDNIFDVIDHTLWIDCERVDRMVADAIIQYAVFSYIRYTKKTSE